MTRVETGSGAISLTNDFKLASITVIPCSSSIARRASIRRLNLVSETMLRMAPGG
jgi:hypothetical protein